MTTETACPHGLIAGECGICIANGVEPNPLVYEYHGPGPAPTRGICRICLVPYKEADPVFERAITTRTDPVSFGWVHQACRP